MKIKRKEFEQKKVELRKRLESAKDEELVEIRKEIEELEKAEIEEDETLEKVNEEKNERSLLRGTIERLEKRSAPIGDAKEIRKENVDKEQEKRISEKAKELRAGRTIKLSSGIERRSVTVSSSGVFVPARTKREIADSYDKPSALVERLNIVPMDGGESYDVPFEKSIGEGGITGEGEAATTSEPIFDHVETNKVKVTAYAEVSEEVEKLPDADYLSRVHQAVVKALKKKIGKLAILGSDKDKPKSFNGIYNADTKVISGNDDINIVSIDADTLNKVVFALGGDEETENEAILILNKKDLEEFAKVKDEDGKFTYKITRNKGTGKISYQNGSAEVEYIINSACNSLTDATQKGTKTMIYGALENFELPLFSEIEVKVSDDYKFKEGMKCIKATVMVGGTVSKYNGFVRVIKDNIQTETTPAV